MSDPSRKPLLHRLQIIEGHVRSVQRMIESDAYCIDIIKQIGAVQSALNKVSEIILEEHLNTCVTSAVRSDNAHDREKALREISEVFQMSHKV
jgi:DNA-binding FrmR family transcriptional regulator